MHAALSIGIGATLGALLRWRLTEYLNPILPNLLLGTLLSNVLGAFLMGIALFISQESSFFSYEIRLGVIIGFLGSLTTFSAFSVEALNLFTKQEYLWLLTLIGVHVVASIFMVAVGYSLSKFLLHSLGGP